MENGVYTVFDGVNIVKVIGKATMKNVQTVEQILEKSEKTPILDLSETDYIDSTFLGLIAKYTMFFKKKNSEYLTILRPTSEVLNNLRQTGILKFLVILDKEILMEGKKVEDITQDSNAKAKQILELHEILMNLNEENRRVFEPVVEQMKKVVKQ